MYKKIEYENNVIVLDGKPYQDSDIPETEFYKLLKQESDNIKWPIDYKTDLTRHDKTSLYVYKPRNFVWIIREYGTHIAIWQEQKEWITYHLDHTPKAFYYYGHYNPLGGYRLDCIPPNKVNHFLNQLARHENKKG